MISRWRLKSCILGITIQGRQLLSKIAVFIHWMELFACYLIFFWPACSIISQIPRVCQRHTNGLAACDPVSPSGCNPLLVWVSGQRACVCPTMEGKKKESNENIESNNFLKEGGTAPTDNPRCVLTFSRFGMPCNGETKYIVLMYEPWGFQKCIWEP